MEEKTLTKPFLFPRGNRLANAHYTGLEAEVTVNLDDRSLHLHDGSTQGGFTVGHLSTLDGGVLTYEESGGGEAGDLGTWGELDLDSEYDLNLLDISPGGRYIAGYTVGPEIDECGLGVALLDVQEKSLIEAHGSAGPIWGTKGLDTVRFFWYGEKLIVQFPTSSGITLARINPNDLTMVWQYQVDIANDRSDYLGLLVFPPIMDSVEYVTRTDSTPIVVEHRSYSEEDGSTTIVLKRLNINTGEVVVTSNPIVVEGYGSSEIKPTIASPTGGEVFLLTPPNDESDTAILRKYNAVTLEEINSITVNAPLSYSKTSWSIFLTTTNLIVTHNGNYGLIYNPDMGALSEPASFISIDLMQGTQRTITLPYHVDIYRRVFSPPGGDSICFISLEGGGLGVTPGERRFVVYDLTKDTVVIDVPIEPEGLGLGRGGFPVSGRVIAGGKYIVDLPISGQYGYKAIRVATDTGEIEVLNDVFSEGEWQEDYIKTLDKISLNAEDTIRAFSSIYTDPENDTVDVDTRVFVRQ